MAFKTKAEKRAWRKGLLTGLRRKKKSASQKKKRAPYKKNKAKESNTSKLYSTPSPGAYTLKGRINENRVDGLSGPVIFWEGFEFDERGRMKGEWIDGKFIPD